jgi:hypothetical protein
LELGSTVSSAILLDRSNRVLQRENGLIEGDRHIQQMTGVVSLEGCGALGGALEFVQIFLEAVFDADRGGGV